jgi:hypothetical protein
MKNHTLEIVPGESIGPFRLGMTASEIEEALRSLSPEPLTLDDLGVIANFPKEEASDGPKHCNQLQIRVFNNDHAVLLLGQPVNGIAMRRLLICSLRSRRTCATTTPVFL